MQVTLLNTPIIFYTIIGVCGFNKANKLAEKYIH